MKIKILIIITLITLIFLSFYNLSNGLDYLYGLIIGKLHSSRIKSNFTYINMNKYSKLLDSRDFVNGYLYGIT